MVKNYDNELNNYLKRQTKFASIETMKNLLLSTISITFNITDANDDRLNQIDYLEYIDKIIKKLELEN